MLLGRKAITNLDSILKRRDITLPTKVWIVKAMAFLVVMYGYESWTTKKAECWRIDALELWCWRRLLRIPWKARRSNQSILKEINPEYSLEGLMLKLQYFGYLMWGANSLEKTPMLGKTEGWRRRRQQGMRWLDASPTRWTWVWARSGSLWWTGKPSVLQCVGCKELDMTERDWTTMAGLVHRCLPFIRRRLVWSLGSLKSPPPQDREPCQQACNTHRPLLLSSLNPELQAPLKEEARGQGTEL